MCGIAGFLDASATRSTEELTNLATGMAAPLAHRGPDDGGTWVGPAAGIAFGHRRLSIIDLSACGHQPMVSRSGRWVLTYNGEIYNHLDLRRELGQRGVVFRGTSDTEVLLGYLDLFGIRATLERADGMFALAAWDVRERLLILARDKVGEKPLYYGRAGRNLVFGSELKSLTAHPDFNAALDRSALTAFLRLSYVPGPLSIYEGVAKLPPGSYVEIHADSAGELPDPVAYWRPPVHRGAEGSAEELLQELDATLREAVRSRMVADVPVGAFLSGGIDSSLVVALMQATSTSQVRTFSIGFEEAAYNEATHAAAVARHLGTEHHELYVSSGQALDVVPRIPSMYDEPFADSSQIPTFLVSEMTRQHVTVALSGDAGDELFGGYGRYRLHAAIWRLLGKVPGRARAAAGRGILRVDIDDWDRLARMLGPVLPSRHRDRVGERAHKLAALLEARHASETYRMLMSHWQEPASLVHGGTEPDLLLADQSRWPKELSRLGQVMYVDQLTYLPDDILVKVDRAAMAVGLETRVPMLAPTVVELAARVPDTMRLRRGGGKWLLRTLLHRYVPAELVQRPKMGFGVPIGDWMRGPLRPWAEDLLSPESLRHNELLDMAQVRHAWDLHLSGTRDLKYQLWNVLMFLEWDRARPARAITEAAAVSDVSRSPGCSP